MPVKTQTKDIDYERIGRAIEEVVISGHARKLRLMWHNFLRGVCFGLGSVIGGTVMVAFVLWILSAFDSVPLAGHFIQSLRDTIHNVR